MLIPAGLTGLALIARRFGKIRRFALWGWLLLAAHGSEAQFTDKVTTTPVIVQDAFGPTGDLLPFDGLSYCCPTAVAMSLSYLGVNGFNQIGPADPTSGDALNLVEVMAGLMGTDPLLGTTSSAYLQSAVEVYLAAKGISTADYTISTQDSPTLGTLATLNQPGPTVVDLECGYYNNSSFARNGGHCVALLSQGVNAQGQSSPNTLVINNPAPSTFAPAPDTASNALQYVNTAPTPSGLATYGALELDPNQYPGFWGSTRLVIQQALVLTVSVGDLSANNPSISAWSLPTTQTIDLQNGTLTVLAPIQGPGGINKGDPGLLELESPDDSAGTNIVVNGALRSDIASGQPFGTGSIQLESGALQLVPAAGSANLSLSAASAPAQSLTFQFGATLALNRNGNTSLALTIGGNTDGTTPNFARAPGSNGTMVIAPAGGTAGLGTSEKVIVNGSGGNLPALTNGIVDPCIVGQDNDGYGSGDFLTYGSAGIAKASYVEATATSITAAGSGAVFDADASQTVPGGASAQVYALKVGAFTVGGVNSTSTLKVGTQTGGEAGIILNGGTISTSNLDFGQAEGVVYASGAGGTISSIIHGVNGLTVFGPGTLTLKGNNNYSGPTNVNSGTLVAEGQASTGSGAVTVEPNATFEISGTSASAGGSGGITVNSGATFRLNGGSATGPLALNPGSYLLGTGKITGTCTILGTIGSSSTDSGYSGFGGVENITFTNSTTFSSSTIYSWRLNALDDTASNAGTDWSLLNFTAHDKTIDMGTSGSPFNISLDLGSGVADPNSGNAFWSQPHQWLAADAPSGFSSIYWANTNFVAFSQGYFSLSTDSPLYNELYVDYSPIPEPGTLGYLAAAALVAAARTVYRRIPSAFQRMRRSFAPCY